MPYITDTDKEHFIKFGASTPGQLNYGLTMLIKQYLEKKTESYQVYNDIIGALEACKLEIYRRKIAPYEDKKAWENGDVWEQPEQTPPVNAMGESDKEVKLIVAGSRNITDAVFVSGILDNYWSTHSQINEVVCGMAKGVDSIGKEWAEANDIPVKEFPADWDKYGRAAGPIRNKQMAEYADAALVIYKPDVSKGSKNMVETMKKLGKPVFEIKMKS